jgi:hypothetical protein
MINCAFRWWNLRLHIYLYVRVGIHWRSKCQAHPRKVSAGCVAARHPIFRRGWSWRGRDANSNGHA